MEIEYNMHKFPVPDWTIEPIEPDQASIKGLVVLVLFTVFMIVVGIVLGFALPGKDTVPEYVIRTPDGFVYSVDKIEYEEGTGCISFDNKRVCGSYTIQENK